MEEMKNMEAITLKDSDSEEQDETPTEQAGTPEVTTTTIPTMTNILDILEDE